MQRNLPVLYLTIYSTVSSYIHPYIRHHSPKLISPFPENPSATDRRHRPVSTPHTTRPYDTSSCSSETLYEEKSKMPRGVKKENLPTKICVTCGRPFNWRKKWERVWDEVTTCSKSCNKKRKNEKKTKTLATGEGAFVKAGPEIVEHIFYERTPDDDDACRSSEQRSTKDANDDDDDGTNVEGENFLNSLSSTTDEATETTPNSETSSQSSLSEIDPAARLRAQRKAAKKAKKAARRAERQGRGDPTAGQKNCDVCTESVNLLVRCTVDKSGKWKMVCGKCWTGVSGGVVDGDGAHPFYRYGGLWKNRRAQEL